MSSILIVSGIQLFQPVSGGHLRSISIANALAELGHKVYIYSFTGRKNDYINKLPSSECIYNYGVTEYVNRNIIFGIMQFISYRLHLPPVWLSLLSKVYKPKLLKEKMKWADTIIIDFPFLYPILVSSKKKGILNTHNVEHHLYNNKLLIQRVKNIEVKSICLADDVLYCNQNDKNYFESLDVCISSKSYIIPNGLSIDEYLINNKDRHSIRSQLSLQGKKVILFVASQYKPNVEAFKALRHWAELNKQFLIDSNICLLVAGSVAEKNLSNDYFKVTGIVDEILPFFSAADYAINPVNTGSGTNIKMMQYVASRIPILTTEFGARGLKLKDKESCFIFDFNNLDNVLSNAIKIDKDILSCISRKSYDDNLEIIDMKIAVANSNIDW